jgi:hypothetical protein
MSHWQTQQQQQTILTALSVDTISGCVAMNAYIDVVFAPNLEPVIVNMRNPVVMDLDVTIG